jgi:hypothetical protein
MRIPKYNLMLKGCHCGFFVTLTISKNCNDEHEPRDHRGALWDCSKSLIQNY